MVQRYGPITPLFCPSGQICISGESQTFTLTVIGFRIFMVYSYTHKQQIHICPLNADPLQNSSTKDLLLAPAHMSACVLQRCRSRTELHPVELQVSSTTHTYTVTCTAVPKTHSPKGHTGLWMGDQRFCGSPSTVAFLPDEVHVSQQCQYSGEDVSHVSW